MFQDIYETNSFILSFVVPNIPGYISGYIFQDISETINFILSSAVPKIPGYIGNRLLPVQRSANQEFHLIRCNKSNRIFLQKTTNINYFPPRKNSKVIFTTLKIMLKTIHYKQKSTFQLEWTPNCMYTRYMHTLHKINFRQIGFQILSKSLPTSL